MVVVREKYKTIFCNHSNRSSNGVLMTNTLHHETEKKIIHQIDAILSFQSLIKQYYKK